MPFNSDKSFLSKRHKALDISKVIDNQAKIAITLFGSTTVSGAAQRTLISQYAYNKESESLYYRMYSLYNHISIPQASSPPLTKGVKVTIHENVDISISNIERFLSYCKDPSHGVMLVYDVHSKDSYRNIEKQLREFTKDFRDATAITLVGYHDPSKASHDNKVVESKSIKSLASQYDVPFFEIDIKDTKAVHAAFNSLLNQHEKLSYALTSCEDKTDLLLPKNTYTKEYKKLISIALKKLDEYQLEVKSRFTWKGLRKVCSSDRMIHQTRCYDILVTAKSSRELIENLLNLKDDIDKSHHGTKKKIYDSLLSKKIQAMLTEMSKINLIFSETYQNIMKERHFSKQTAKVPLSSDEDKSAGASGSRLEKNMVELRLFNSISTQPKKISEQQDEEIVKEPKNLEKNGIELSSFSS